MGLVRPLAKAAGKLETRDAILQYYVQLVRENLHVCLCMSPIGAGFRNRCRMFPSLVNCCTVDWFNVSFFLCSFLVVLDAEECWGLKHNPFHEIVRTRNMTTSSGQEDRVAKHFPPTDRRQPFLLV